MIGGHVITEVQISILNSFDHFGTDEVSPATQDVN